MLPFSATAAKQIRYLLLSGNDSNFDSIIGELCQFAEYGSGGCIILLQTCLDLVGLSSEDMQNIQLKPELVSAVFRYLLDRPNFSTVFCEALRSTWISDEFLANLSKALNLSTFEKIGLGLALTDLENLDLRMRGQNFCIAQIEEICANPISIMSHQQIQDIVMFLYQSEGLSKHVDSFTKMLSLLQLKDNSSFILDPILTDDLHLDLFYECSDNDFDSVLAEIEKEMSMADIVKELGYEFTNNMLHCKEMLSLFLPLNEMTVSKILGTIARTRIGLEDSQNIHSTFCSAIGISSAVDSAGLSTWNIDVLVDSIKQLAPETNWRRVMENLDHEGFYIPDAQAFSLFMSIYAHASQDPFPLHAICGAVWKNAEGQLSFLRHAVSAPSEIFTFAHSGRKLQYMESIAPVNGYGNEAWFCLDLLEVLCQLSERGNASSVRTMLEYPLKFFPEAILIGIAHANSVYNLLQYEVSLAVFPSVVKNTTKSSVIHHLWNVNPNLVLRGFVDMHNIDPDSISRILDICQELKILSSVLEATPFSFSIKLAAFASRKDCLNLEKWFNENLSTYEGAFCEDCIKFLKEIFGNGANDSSFQHSGGLVNIYQETASTLLKVLQGHSGQLIPEQLSEEIKKLHISSHHDNMGMQSGATADLLASDGSPDDVEAEANAYFHQMFSENLSVDSMVQTLARFKESSDKREQLIFECMIGNLFEEYKFFPKYPDRQLKVAAVLFGSLIKHQLVTHLTLGIALRCVLDALRKSVDTKMFMFGAKALEQFMDRLIEWPQYCNHILQISHLRGTHAELVSFIERALARISSSQSELNGGNSLPRDQNQGSSFQSSAENIEASEVSWQSVNTSSAQSGQQPSPQLQQRHQGLVEDRLKPPATSVTYMKSFVVPAGQSTLASSHVDSVSSQKVIVTQSLQTPSQQHPASVTTTVVQSPGFLRPPRGIAPAGMLRQPSYNIGFGAALNIETLVAAAERRDTQIEAPVSEIQDKILFMINNISATNMDVKAKEFTEILNEQYYTWFAQYMVMKRASIEPNFHDLYLKFLDKVNSKSLNKEIVKATYENCKVLLRSDLIKSSSEERSLLKNLGSWLGKFTIGRNQALRAKEIDPKVLIIEAYEKGLMIAVIPFTSKILEPCQCSLAYKPPNPWTMGILGLLAEIYNLPNLKMNLKFDIEVLFKNLGVDLKDVKPTLLLKDRVREVEGNPDFSNKDAGLSQPVMVPEVNSGVIPSLNPVELQPEVKSTHHPAVHPNVLSQYTAPLHLASSTLSEEEKMGTLSIPDRVPSAQGLSQVTQPQSPYSVNQLLSPIPNIGTHVIVNQKLNALGLHLQMQRIVPVAMERAIREIISPVVQRSVTIASQTTKELVLKDYAMESDESRIHNAAHLMVASLAGSLAHVTCKEPLRVAMSNHLRSLLQTMNVAAELLEQAVQLVTNDNLDLGCAVIEQAATEKALQTIDGEIAPSLSYRRKQREGTGSAYYDAGAYGQGPFARVPEALRPKPGRLSVAQQRVYEDFVRFPWQNQSSQSSNVVPASQPDSAGGSLSSSLPRGYGSSSGQLNSSIYSTSQVAPGFSASASPLDLISEEMDPGVSSANAGVSDVAMQHSGEINSVISSFPPPPESRVVESSAAAKELGAVVPPSSMTATERLGTVVAEPLLSTGDALDKYQILAQKLESLIAKDARDVDIQGFIAEVPEIVLKCVSRDEAALAVAQKAFKSLYDNASNNMHVGSYLAILSAVRDVCKLVVKELTSWVIYSDEERKFNKDITVGLIRSELLNLAEYNVHMAKLIDGGRNNSATEFAISLVRTLAVQEPGISAEFYNTIDALSKLMGRPGAPESLVQFFEILKNSTANVISLPGLNVTKEEKARQAREKKNLPGHSITSREDYSSAEAAAADTPGFREQVTVLFNDWFRINDLPATSDAACTHYISQLQQNGLLKGDDLTDRFFRVLMELAVAHCLATEQVIAPSQLSFQLPQQVQHLSFVAIDAYAKLVVLVFKYCLLDQGSSKITLLPKILSVAVKIIQKDAEEKKSSFNPRPYFRLFVYWLWELNSSEPVLDGVSFQVLTYFANSFHALQPLKVPGWSFAWLELVSHRSFMPKLLRGNSHKGWPFFQRLLVDLFKFMEPCLRNAELGNTVLFLYKGTLRVLLVLLHDFPDFLCEYHFSFCDVIPPSCIQMRNVILSAFPPNMRLPDPSTPNLKIDLLAEISQSPRILSDVDGALKAKQLKADIDEYLKTRPQGSSFLAELKQRLLLPESEAIQAGTRYNVPLINSLVLYVGMQAIQQLQNKTTQHAPTPEMAHTTPMSIFLVGAAMDIFQCLVRDLDTEGRYLFLNAVANQLRYPNNHTHYFSFVLLFLFAEANQDIIQEQITRVLLERLIVNRPHPWGMLITFIELIKNPRYNFWGRPFTRCAPEIEKLLEQMSRSCGAQKTVDDGMISGGSSDSGH